MKKLEKDLTQYIKDMHNQDECSGYIDGYNAAQSNTNKKIINAFFIGALFGGLLYCIITII